MHDAGFYEDRAIEAPHRVGRHGDRHRRGAPSPWPTASGCPGTACCSRPAPSPGGLGLPGADLDGVLYLRTLADSERLRGGDLGTGGRLVVVGAGWIGSEAAASARQLGHGGDPAGAVGRAARERPRADGRAGSTRTSTASTGSSSWRAPPWRRSRAPAAWSASGWPVGARSTARPSSSGSARSRARRSPRPPGSRWTTGSWRTPRCARASPASTRPATSPTPRTPSTGGACAWSTGPTPSTRGRPRRATCSAATRPTTASRTSSRTSTTWAWSTRASPAAPTRWCCAATCESRELIAFWLADGRVAAGMNINVWDVTEPIQALIRSRAPVNPARLRDPGVPLEALVPDDGARAPLTVRAPPQWTLGRPRPGPPRELRRPEDSAHHGGGTGAARAGTGSDAVERAGPKLRLSARCGRSRATCGLSRPAPFLATACSRYRPGASALPPRRPLKWSLLAPAASVWRKPPMLRWSVQRRTFPVARAGRFAVQRLAERNPRRGRCTVNLVTACSVSR